jgi:hypothetical protein
LTTTACAITKHWVDQYLAREGHLSTIARGDSHHGGVTTACTFSHYGDACAVYAQYLG